jgi:hypothetical protein
MPDVVTGLETGAAPTPGAPNADPSPPSRGGFELSTHDPKLDADEIAYQAALEAVKAEQQPDPGTPGGEPSDPPAPAAPDAGAAPAAPAAGAAPGQKPQGQKPIMVPKARLDEALRDRQHYSDMAHYLKGQLDIMAQTGRQPAPADAGQPASQQQDQQPTPQDRMKALRAEKLKVEKEYEEAQITSEQRAEKLADIDDKIMDAKIEAKNPAPTKQTQAPSSVMDQALENAHAVQLESHFPYLKVMDDQQLQFMSHMAHTEAAALGRPYGAGPAENIKLRQRVAELSNLYGPQWHPTFDPKQHQASPSPGTQPGGKTPSNAATARGKKLDLAAQLPPDTRNLGRAGDPQTITAADIEKMSDIEIENLPQATRDKFLRG